LFFSGLGINPTFEKLCYKSKTLLSVEGPGFWADTDIKNELPQHYKSYLTDLLGFEPIVSIGLSYDKSQDSSKSLASMLKATIALVHQTHWNIGFELEYGGVILLHKDGELFIKHPVEGYEYDIWTQDLLDLIKIPYTVKDDL